MNEFQEGASPKARSYANKAVENGGEWFMSGSRFVCDPAPTDTDEDLVVWLPQDDTFAAYLSGESFCGGGIYRYHRPYEEPMKDFVSWRQGDLNVIVTTNRELFDKFYLATRVAKLLNVLDKGKRLALFEAVIDGRYLPDVERPKGYHKKGYHKKGYHKKGVACAPADCSFEELF